MKIYFARHGRTNYNDAGLCNGDPTVDVHITAAGKAQADALADHLKDTAIECIYVSELKRTLQTAEIVNVFHKVPIKTSPLLNDNRSGYEGKPFTEYMDALAKAPDRWTARLNGGESIEDMKQRVAKFLDDLKSQPYDVVLVVTSQWVIHAAAAILQHLSNEDAWKLDVQQGSYLEFEV